MIKGSDPNHIWSISLMKYGFYSYFSAIIVRIFRNNPKKAHLNYRVVFHGRPYSNILF